MSTATLDRYAASYERISRFRVNRDGVDAEISRGVDRQATDNLTCAEGMRLGPVVRFTDEDRSASQFATKERDRWVALLDAIREGRVTHVLVWLFDRAFRTTEACEALLSACRAGGALIVQTAGSPVVADPSNPDDIFRMKLAGLLAEYEVAKMSMRQRRVKLDAAEKGRPHGGRRRFGYEPGNAVARHPEAERVQALVTRFLAGESLHALAKWMNDPATGMPTPSGAKWTGPNLRHLLGGPHLAGLVVRKGQILPGVVGQWDAIIPVETHHHVRAILDNPERRTSTTNARKWLLSGLAVCDECGEKVRARPRTGRNEAPAYRCPSGRHVQRAQEKVDAYVSDVIVARLARFDTSGVLVDDTAADEVNRLREARAALDTAYDALVAEHRAGTMTARAYAAATSGMESDMDALDVAIREATEGASRAGRVLAGATGELAAEAWASWSLARRRAIIDELAEVRLVGGKRGGVFHTADVVIRWR